MKKINLAIGIHNHQPVGNFDFVFSDAFEKAYQPFLDVLENHPNIRIAQHYSGILLDWIKRNKPNFINQLKMLVTSGQIEMMTGGFYEPIMSIIPDQDKVGQISKLTKFIESETGFHPTGMWLAERIWEPHLPKPCTAAGINYTILDDSHFKTAGLKDNDLFGYYITEEQGAKLNLFPISERLRYTIPFQSPEETISYLESVASEEEQRLVVFADDGEKFGVWPGTYEHCYRDGWLKAFFEALQANRDWINIIHFSEVLQRLRPVGRIYLPAASYREMMEWSMPTSSIHEYEKFEAVLQEQELHDRFKIFVRGGFWRNFLMKYPESNNMHKKMLYLSNRLSRLQTSRGSDVRFEEASDHLWAGQCNCPYWHGVFGGLYLNHLRFATYRELIQAETLIDELERTSNEQKKGWIECEVTDFDTDGSQEILVSTDKMNLYFSPAYGGSLFELDFKPKAINLLDTLTRREEAYHEKLRLAHKKEESYSESYAESKVSSIHDLALTKEDGLENLLFYDSYRRSSFRDHFLDAETSLRQFYQNSHEEQGDFVNTPYNYNFEKSNQGLVVKLSRDGKVSVGQQQGQIFLEKHFFINKQSPSVRVEYHITNQDDMNRAFWFGTELNFSLLAGDAPDRYYFFPGFELDDARLRSMGEVTSAKEAQLIDEWLGIKIRVKVDKVSCFWRFPIETISQSEAGFERVYQSSVLFPNWKLNLKPNAQWKTCLILQIEEERK